MEKLMAKDFISSLNKKDILEILENFHIPYKKNAAKESLEILMYDNINKIVSDVFDLFNQDEYINIKLVVKKNGLVFTKVNHLLKDFLNNLSRYHLVKKDGNIFIMPHEFVKAFAKKVNDKKSINIIKINTEENNLILGLTAVYGVVEYEFFYKKFSEKFSYEKEGLLSKLTILSEFYGEFKIFKEKNKIYISNKVFKTISSIKKYINSLEYKDYDIKDILNISTLKYMEKYHSYRKLKRFIDRNYYVEKSSFKIINKFIFIPFLAIYETDSKKAFKELDTLIDKYFQFKSEKNKKKFILLITKMAQDYPKWNLKGERKESHAKKES